MPWREASSLARIGPEKKWRLATDDSASVVFTEFLGLILSYRGGKLDIPTIFISPSSFRDRASLLASLASFYETILLVY